MSGFDPYLIWLDIPPHERPATYYRLLGLRPLENDPQTIAASAQRVIAHVSQFQQSEHGQLCAQLLAELTAARDCLLNPVRKQAYDSGIAQSHTSHPATSGSVSPERPLSGPIPTSGPTSPQTGAPQPSYSPERPIGSTPQVPGQAAGERQIPQSPPVPQQPQPGVTSTPGFSYPPASTPGEQPLPSGPPQSVQPTIGTPPPVPGSPTQTPSTPAAYPTTPNVNPPANQATPYSPAPEASAGTDYSPTTPATPPSWAAANRTGEVGTVVAGQGGATQHEQTEDQPQSLGAGRTRHGRNLRRSQQTQSAYMLVGIAMAMIVFFFGAVLLLAIYLNVQ